MINCVCVLSMLWWLKSSTLFVLVWNEGVGWWVWLSLCKYVSLACVRTHTHTHIHTKIRFRCCLCFIKQNQALISVCVCSSRGFMSGKKMNVLLSLPSNKDFAQMTDAKFSHLGSSSIHTAAEFDYTFSCSAIHEGRIHFRILSLFANRSQVTVVSKPITFFLFCHLSSMTDLSVLVSVAFLMRSWI